MHAWTLYSYIATMTENLSGPSSSVIAIVESDSKE